MCSLWRHDLDISDLNIGLDIIVLNVAHDQKKTVILGLFSTRSRPTVLTVSNESLYWEKMWNIEILTLRCATDDSRTSQKNTLVRFLDFRNEIWYHIALWTTSTIFRTHNVINSSLVFRTFWWKSQTKYFFFVSIDGNRSMHIVPCTRSMFQYIVGWFVLVYVSLKQYFYFSVALYKLQEVVEQKFFEAIKQFVIRANQIRISSPNKREKLRKLIWVMTRMIIR